jgi:hypothetical protein
MRTHVLSGVLASLIACSEEDPPSQYADSTLEQATVQPDEPLEGPRRDAGGTFHGDLEGGDLTLTVGSSTAAVHAPGFPDLTAFDGITGFMSIVEVSPAGEASLLVRDEYDGVIYLIETIEPDVLTAEAFGGNFISLGNDLGVTSAHQGEMRIYSAMVLTDNGEVEVFPGEPQEILVGGVSYRVVVTAAWHRELDPSASFNCAIREDVLAYEVQRVEPDTADTTPLVRDPLFPIEQGSCGLPPPPSPG